MPRRPAEAADLIAQARERTDLARIARARAEIEALPPGETLFVGGLSVYRLKPDYPGRALYNSNVSGGDLEYGDPGYIAHVEPGQDPVEVLQTQRANPLFRERHARALRLGFQHGMPGVRTQATVWRFIDAAVAANAHLPRYQTLRAAFPELDEIIVPLSSETKDARVTYQVKDILNNASWQGVYAAVNSEVVKVGLELQAKGSAGFHDYSPDGTGIPKPGDSGSQDAGGLAATLRHEYGHGVWERLTDAEQDAFMALLPDEQAINDGLTHYASLVNVREFDPGRERSYESVVRGGYRTETFAELVAVATHPGFDPDTYPAWVQETADWLDALCAARAA